MTDDRPRATGGFTLVELAIVIAIAAILIGVAAPDLARTEATRAIASQASEFMAGLRYARSEAMKRGEPVTMCAADGMATSRRCVDGRGADWRAGWLVFVDHGDRGAFNDGDQLLRVQPPLLRTGGVDGTRSSVTYTSAGFSTDAASHYLFNPPMPAGGQAPPALLVCVSKQGRPRLAPGAICN